MIEPKPFSRRSWLRRTPGCWIFERVAAPLTTPGAISRVISLDHLVGACEQRRRNFEAERLGGLEVNNQVDFRDLLNRQISRLVAVEDAAGVDGRYNSVTLPP